MPRKPIKKYNQKAVKPPHHSKVFDLIEEPEKKVKQITYPQYRVNTLTNYVYKVSAEDKAILITETKVEHITNTEQVAQVMNQSKYATVEVEVYTAALEKFEASVKNQ